MKRGALSKIKILLIGFFGSIVLRLINLTLRWERVGLSGTKRWWADGTPSILLFWHGRQLFMPWIYLNHRKSKDAPDLTALISQHSDGQMIAKAMHFLGIKSVAGSSTQGGLRALHLLIDALKKNNSHIAITPDGPKGPPQKFKRGALLIARRSGATIHPAAFAAEKCWRFKSWDGMILPKPFSRAVLVKGAAFSIARDINSDNFASISVEIEAILNEVTKSADDYFGGASRQ